ncbi:MAG: C25 family cysteine peptidase [Kiritimatiellia bacterium]|jgi:hypothetical protein
MSSKKVRFIRMGQGALSFALFIGVVAPAVIASGFSGSVVAVFATREEAGIRLDWFVDGGWEANPSWVAEVRRVDGDSGRVWKVAGEETSFGREPDRTHYTAWLPADVQVDALDVRLWAEGLQDRPEVGWETPVVEPPVVDPPKRMPRALPATVRSEPAERVRLVVAETGRYVVSAAAIASHLAPGTEQAVRNWIATTNLALFCMDEPVAWHPVGDNDGIAFIGHAYRDVYTDRNVYWIDQAPGLAMAEATVSPITNAPVRGDFWHEERIEPDRELRETLPFERPFDNWYWDFVDFPGKTTLLLPFETPDAVHGADPATLRIWSRPFTSNATFPEPHVSFALSLGGTTLATPTAGGVGPAVMTCSAPSSLLAPSNNLKIDIAATNGVARARFAIDSLTVKYRRAMVSRAGELGVTLDITCAPIAADGFSSSSIDAYAIENSCNPVRLTGASITVATNGSWQIAFTAPAAVSNLWLADAFRVPEVVEGVGADPWAGAHHAVDWLVVAPEAFFEALQPLVQARAAQGLRTGMLKTEDLYLREMGGRFSPYALRSFLARSRAWSVPPKMVLLVGDGNYDYLGIYGSPSWQPNFIPPAVLRIPYARSPTGLMILGTDNALADLDDNGVPDVMIGRLPARSVAEVNRMVSKTLVADAARESRTAVAAIADIDAPGYNFPQNTLDWLADLPDRLSKQFISEYDAPAGSSVETKRSYIGTTWRAALDSGVWFSAYFGHACAWYLGEKPFYLHFNTVASLTNSPGVLIGMTCDMNTHFKPYTTSTSASCVGAELLRGTDGGMVAVYAPASISFELPEKVVATAVADAISARAPYLGNAVMKSLNVLKESGQTPWLLQTMLLFGDPALEIRTAESVQPWNGSSVFLK